MLTIESKLYFEKQATYPIFAPPFLPISKLLKWILVSFMVSK